MKVLLVNTVPLEANGISTFIINSAEVMAERGIDVTISAPNTVDLKLRYKLEKQGISIIELPDRTHNLIKYYFKFKKILTNNIYDIVHVNGNSTTMALELAIARHKNVKLRIGHSHNTITEHPIINKLLRPTFEKNINGRLACNEEAGKWLFKKKHFTVIKNGIFLKKYLFNPQIREQIRNKYNITKDELLIGHVGAFNYQKNQTFFVELLQKLNPKYKLILIGNGPDFDSIKQLSVDNNISDKIVFTGTVNNVNEYMSAMDIFALPSRFEGQPFVVIEALASGLSVIVSDKVSKEINITKSVRFAKLENLNEWINSIYALNKNKSSRKDSSVNNIGKLIQRGYDIENNVGVDLISFYKNHLNKN